MPDDDIIVVEYDPGWPARFNVEKQQLLAALAPVDARVEHVGSTAVPGLCAKPVLDILVGVDELRPADCYASRLDGLGYVWRDSEEPGRHFFAKVPRTVHVHVVRYRSWDWYGKIWFRDLLRRDGSAMANYGFLKLRSAAAFRQDRHAYSKSKDAMVEGLLRVEVEGRIVHESSYKPMVLSAGR